MGEPQFVLGRQHSTNPLVAAPERIKRLVFALALGLAYAIAAYILVVFAIVAVGWIVHELSTDGVNFEIPDPMERAWLVAVLYGPSVFLAYRQIARSARHRASRCEFTAARLVVVKASRGRGAVETRDLALSDVGSIEFVPPGRIELAFGPDGDAFDQGDVVTIDLRAPTAEDEFESLERYLDEHAPDALRSIVSDESVDYSRRWNWSDLFPWQQPTRRAQYQMADDKGCRTIDTGAHELLVTARSTVGQPGDSDEVAFRVIESRIIDRRGMVLARVARDTFRISLESGCGARLEIRRSDSKVHLDGRQIGELSTRWSVTTLLTEIAIPEPLAAMLLLCRDG